MAIIRDVAEAIRETQRRLVMEVDELPDDHKNACGVF